CFDATDTGRYPERRPLLFLHGALHLVRFPDGDSCKLHSGQHGGNLLDLFGQGVVEGREPLFVSEGTAEEKEGSIKRSNYLTFVHERFASDQAPIVIFGQSLSAGDRHLRRALMRSPTRRFAISVRAHATDEVVIARKLELMTALPHR